MNGRRAIAVTTVTLLLIAGVWLHLPGLNGPPYWPWMWIRRSNAAQIVVLFALAATPALAALFVRRRVAAVALVIVSAIALQFAAASLTGITARQRVTLLISDPANTSYYTAAMQVLELKHRRRTSTWCGTSIASSVFSRCTDERSRCCP